MNIEPYDSLSSMYLAAADRFCGLVQAATSAGRPVRISLSGGSTPRRLYEMLSERDLDWSRVHWFWGDERNVPHDHQDSNYRMVREAWLDRIDAPVANVHPVPVNVADPSTAARAYQQTLAKHFPDQPFPAWDLVLLGMGDDSHTASLFPGTEAIGEQQRWFVENWVDKFSSHRYTLSAPAINSGREIWFMVSGAGKRQALSNVLSTPAQPKEYPAQLIHPTHWFVTQDAM